MIYLKMNASQNVRLSRWGVDMEDYKKYLFYPMFFAAIAYLVHLHFYNFNEEIWAMLCTIFYLMAGLWLLVNLWLWASEYYKLDMNFKITKNKGIND